MGKHIFFNDLVCYSSEAAAAAAAAAPLQPGAPEFPSRVYIYYPQKSAELRPDRRRILEEELIDRRGVSSMF